MENSNQRNLDYLAAKYAQNIVKELVNNKNTDAGSVDNTVTKTLGVLQTDGVYACFLYLFAKEKDNGGVVIENMLNLLAALPFGWEKPDDKSSDSVLTYINEQIPENLERLLLARETLEQMLIYARYGSKARKAAAESSKNGGNRELESL